MRGRSGVLLGVVAVFLLARGVPRAWAQAVNSLVSVNAAATDSYSGPRTPAGTYPITVTATGASFTRTLEVTLIVRD